VRAAANAQQTRDLLIPGEQFGMGGADSVRGYYERETASDVGRRFSLEGYGPDFGSWVGSTWRARALLFADAARGHDRSNDSGPVRGPETSSEASAWACARTKANPSRSGSMWHALPRMRAPV